MSTHENSSPLFSNESEMLDVGNRGLFARYFPWFVGAILILIVGLGITIYLMLLDPIAEPASRCLEALSRESAVSEKLGLPLNPTSKQVTGKFEANGSKVYALLDKFEVSGPNGTAAVEATMAKRRKNFDWVLWKARVQFGDGTSILIDKSG